MTTRSSVVPNVQVPLACSTCGAAGGHTRRAAAFTVVVVARCGVEVATTGMPGDASARSGRGSRTTSATAAETMTTVAPIVKAAGLTCGDRYQRARARVA